MYSPYIKGKGLGADYMSPVTGIQQSLNQTQMQSDSEELLDVIAISRDASATAQSEENDTLLDEIKHSPNKRWLQKLGDDQFMPRLQYNGLLSTTD